MYKHLILPIMSALSSNDAEKAHEFALKAFRILQHTPLALPLIGLLCEAHKNPQPVRIAGITFPNRIGMAAGFDKDGQVVPMLEALGFGFVEIGTVTPRLQFGNPRVRLLRIAHEAIWNCMGFNNDGSRSIARRLADSDSCGDIHIPVGVSIGKQKETKIEEASRDYQVVKLMFDENYRPAYYVVNISSPNTVGLRLLQGREYISGIVHPLVESEQQRTSLPALQTPVAVKFAPDMADPEIAEAIGAAVDAGVRILIFGNTTIQRPDGVAARAEFFDDSGNPRGGYSGPHLFERTLARVKFARTLTDVPIIAVGGISKADDARRLYDAGADLLQILTGFIYQGPALVKKLRSVQK